MKITKTANLYKNIQHSICQILEDADGEGRFSEVAWEKEIGSGLSCVMQNGSLIEKAAVNFSSVHGNLTPNMSHLLGEHAQSYMATGISSIIHSGNPFIPTIHFNVRYFVLDNGSAWFGGGMDLTPVYIQEEEATWFHHRLKEICDRYNTSFYPEWKNLADDYYFLPHRGETRGIGGIFFDRIQPNDEKNFENMLNLTSDLANSYPLIYSHLMNENKQKSFTEAQKKWQKIRRGRYVEFNLIHDRGTKFGLESDGNIESILVSLPPEVDWIYEYHPEPGSPEAKTQSLLKKGIDWIK